MPEDLFPEAESPQSVQWAADAADQPTFPEGAWTHKTALVESPLEGQQKYQVKFEGVYWTAIAVDSDLQLTPGETVAVIGRDGTELVIQQLPDRQVMPPDTLVPEAIAIPPGQNPPLDALI